MGLGSAIDNGWEGIWEGYKLSTLGGDFLKWVSSFHLEGGLGGLVMF